LYERTLAEIAARAGFGGSLYLKMLAKNMSVFAQSLYVTSPPVADEGTGPAQAFSPGGIRVTGDIFQPRIVVDDVEI
jgi:hypothetical protein